MAKKKIQTVSIVVSLSPALIISVGYSFVRCTFFQIWEVRGSKGRGIRVSKPSEGRICRGGRREVEREGRGGIVGEVRGRNYGRDK